MPTKSFAEFERTWPWLSEEEAEAMVAEGKHSMNLNRVRQMAEQLGYEEWFYCSNSKNDTDDNTAKPCQQGETLAFQKRFTTTASETATTTKEKHRNGDAVVKVLYYPRTGAVSICTFSFPPNSSCRVIPRPDLGEEGNLFTWLGLVPALDEHCDCTKADALFNPRSEKSFQAIPNVSKLKQWRGLLLLASSDADAFNKKSTSRNNPPSCGTEITGLVQFKRTDWLLGRWHTPGQMESPCCKDSDQSTKDTKWIFDVALRWHHMATAIGFDLEYMPVICNICHVMESTLFEPGPSSLSRTRFCCGSYCAILELLLNVAKEYHNAIGFTGARYATQLLEGRLLFPIQGHHYGVTFGTGCEYRQEFLDDGHGPSLEKLKAALVSLPSHIRLEVLVFFFERTSTCYGNKVLIDKHFQPLWSPLYPLLRNASMDFSRLFAGDNSEQHYCYSCGLFRHAFGEDEYNDDMDGATVATLSSQSLVSGDEDDSSIENTENEDGSIESTENEDGNGVTGEVPY